MTAYHLHYGTHATPQEGRCAMEWVAHLAGEPHTDQPACVSPVLRAICIALNDGLEDEPRQRLRPYLARTIGTAGDGRDTERAWLALDWIVRTHTPAWLRASGRVTNAQRLSGLARIDGPTSLARALGPLDEVRARARQLRRTTVSPGPWDPVRATARELAWSGAGAAAWAAARLGIGDLAGDRARAAAQSAAGDAAAVIARRAVDAQPAALGRAAQKDLVRAALAPVRLWSERSAMALLEQMLPLEPITLPAAAGAFTVSV